MDKEKDYRTVSVDGQQMIIAVGEKSKNDKRIIKMNDSAREIWEMLQSGADKVHIADMLCEKYQITRENAILSIDNVIAAMENNGQGEKIENIIKEKGYAVSTPSGNSMNPMLKNRRDTVIIKKITAPLKKYDVILYKRKESYILHRIIKVTNDGYVIRGDNCYFTETDIKDENILGKMTEFYRKNKHYSEKDTVYRIYSVLRVNTYWLRSFFRKIRTVLSKIKHLIVK